MLVCTGPGCNQTKPGEFRKLANMPELYWERARECKEKQMRNGDQECEVSLEEIQDKKHEEAEPQR
jgi:hypothetical protein